MTFWWPLGPLDALSKFIKYLIGFSRNILSLHIQPYFNLPFTILIMDVLISADKEAFFLTATLPVVCLPNREMLIPAAAPRGYHFEIIIGIQFGFVNMDRALLHSDSWACLMWSSACQPVSSIFVTQTPEPHYSWQKGQSFFTERTDFFLSLSLPRCLFPVRGEFHDTLSPARPCGSPPLPQQTTSGLGLGWISSGLYPLALRTQICVAQ